MSNWQSPASLAMLQQQLKGFVHLRFQRLWGVGQMANGELELPPFRTQDGAAVKVLRHVSGVESCRHDHDAEIRPCLLQAFEQRQRQIRRVG